MEEKNKNVIEGTAEEKIEEKKQSKFRLDWYTILAFAIMFIGVISTIYYVVRMAVK
jgi:hypothetical protein